MAAERSGETTPSSSDSTSAQGACKKQVTRLVKLFRTPLLSEYGEAQLLDKANRQSGKNEYTRLDGIATEACYNIQVQGEEPLSTRDWETLQWLLRETFAPEQLTTESQLNGGGPVVEVGPRLAFKTPWCTNAVAVCAACGLGERITRIEVSRRYELRAEKNTESHNGTNISEAQLGDFADMVHDKMTERVFDKPLESFDADISPPSMEYIDVMGLGRAAIENANEEMGLAFDEWDLNYYTQLFQEKLRRNPTNVELFDIAQSNSEHSRHWFFKGDLEIDGKPIPECLLDIVRDTLKANPDNSVIAYKDNSSAIRGGKVSVLSAENPGNPSPLSPVEKDMDILFTAETHNFPSGKFDIQCL